MKLSNQQIDALVAKVQKVAEEKRDAEIKKRKNNPKIQSLANQYVAIAKKLPNDIRRLFYMDDARDFKNTIIEHLIDKKNLPEECYSKDTKNKILIASIDANDLDQLQKALGITL